MKRTISLILLLCFITSASAWKPIFAGHRGSLLGVSNTIEAFKSAVDHYGYAGIECDVRVTADKQYVIMHDETTNSLGGKLNVATSTLDQLKAEILTQTRSGITYTGTICTVGEYLDICIEKNVFPLIELKWTTGINDNDMSNFKGLIELISSKGLNSKAIFLTSMKKSIEHIRSNYPNVTCQFLTGQYWANHVEWCIKWNVGPSIQAGYLDIYTVKKFRDVGLKVAVWTVNDEANYKKYGNMGIYMMTCDYLQSKNMEELEDINWNDILDKIDPLEITASTLWSVTQNNGNLPPNFPIGGTGKYATAQQAAFYNGVCFTNDYATSTLLAYGEDGEVPLEIKGTASHGIAVDDAGNLILRNDGITSNPSKLIIYPNGSSIAKEITFSLPKNGQANFIFASGDILSNEGGYIYMYANSQKFVNILHVVMGEIKEIIISNELSISATTAGIVIPIGNDPDNFIYQVRNVGYYLYKDGVNKGDYLTGKASTTLPTRNSSLGGAYFTLGGHDILVHPSGANYNGGISVKDMTADMTTLCSFPDMGNAGYAGNPSTGTFIKAEQVDAFTYNIYAYCLGNGYAAYQIKKIPSGVVDNIIEPSKVDIFPNPTTDVINIKYSQPITKIGLYTVSGNKVIDLSGNGKNNDQLDISHLNNGIYILKINDTNATRIIKK